MPEKKRLYLGIDAGATKTHALIADQDGHARGIGQAGPGNWEGVGLEGAYEVYSQALQQALSAGGLQVGDLCAAGYALAGLDFPGDMARLTPIIERLGVPGPRILVNDTFGALRAGASQGYGVVIIAGTGTTVAGSNRQGERFRTFGEGQVFGDVGGAGDIIWLALRAVAQAYTGRGEPTALTERFLQAAGAHEALEYFEGLCRGLIEPPNASMAPIVFEVAAAGDRVAQGIIRYAGHELGANAAAIAGRLELFDDPFELVLAGGVFRSKSELLLQAILEPVQAVASQVQPVILQTAPVAGSTLLAMDADGQAVLPQVHKRLADETQRLVAAVDE